jgi:hypothetical protein
VTVNLKKIPIYAIILTLAILISVQMAPSANASSSLNVTYEWQGITFKGYDDFYGSDIIAFTAGSTAMLTVNIVNNIYWQMNVSAVKVRFDWNQNFSATGDFSDTNPRIIAHDVSCEFVVSFTVPTTGISNLFKHSYDIYVEHVNSTTTPQELRTPHVISGGSNFVVFSSDQAAYQTSRIQYSDLSTSYPESYFTAVDAYYQYALASSYHLTAARSYRIGNFSDAKFWEQNAVYLYNLAIFIQKNKINWIMENNEISNSNATVKLAEAEAKYMDAQANYYNFLANAWIIFSVGFLLMGVGVLVYAARKPKVMPQQKPA